MNMETAKVTNLRDCVWVLTLPVNGRYIPFTLMPRSSTVIEADRVQSVPSVRDWVHQGILSVEAVEAISAAPAVKKKVRPPVRENAPDASSE